jgi:peptidoglycan/LPS O-acetylase OafA/YrhL
MKNYDFIEAIQSASGANPIPAIVQVRAKDEASASVPGALNSEKTILPNLDGIRAMACLLVVISHMPLPGKPATLGALGVGVFFVLSGFLMSHLYARTQWDFTAVSKYIIARFSRIAPIYWLVVSACIVISLLEPDSDFPMRIAGANQIARHYLFGGSGYVFWSIPPEIQYYIFFLGVWWAIAHHAKLPYAMPLIALVCAALLMTHSLWPGLSLPSKLHLFLAGTAAGLAPRGMWRDAQDQTLLWCVQLGALVLLLAPLWLYATQPALYSATELGIALAVAVYLLSIPSRWTTPVFASPWMRKIGQASFSIYLMHVLVFHFGMRLLGLNRTQYDPMWLVLGLAAVVIPMVVSRYVEIPLQRKTRKALEAWFGFASVIRVQPSGTPAHMNTQMNTK